MADEPQVCPCCGCGFGCDCFGSGCPICRRCQAHCAGASEHTPERICLVPRDQIKLVSSDGHEILGTLEMDDDEHVDFCRADGVCISLSDDTLTDSVFSAIFRCRQAQDAKHGGAEHDDMHTPSEWCQFIQKFRNRAELEPESYEENLIHIAALAVAAVESSRRKKRNADVKTTSAKGAHILR
jgi:pyridoxine 5'-phosphate synthase PdxJ